MQNLVHRLEYFLLFCACIAAHQLVGKAGINSMPVSGCGAIRV